jgi:hypothetical protein
MTNITKISKKKIIKKLFISKTYFAKTMPQSELQHFSDTNCCVLQAIHKIFATENLVKELFFQYIILKLRKPIHNMPSIKRFVVTESTYKSPIAARSNYFTLPHIV